MKSFAVLLPAALLAGCIEGGGPDALAPSGHTLPSDAHYVVVPPGYPTPEACIASEQQPFSCLESLSLCKDGRAGWRLGDIVYKGTYRREASIAHVTFDDGETLDFDVDTVEELDAPNVDWIVDTEQRWNTLQFDNILCSQP